MRLQDWIKNGKQSVQTKVNTTIEELKIGLGLADSTLEEAQREFLTKRLEREIQRWNSQQHETNDTDLDSRTIDTAKLSKL